MISIKRKKMFSFSKLQLLCLLCICHITDYLKSQQLKRTSIDYFPFWGSGMLAALHWVFLT